MRLQPFDAGRNKYFKGNGFMGPILFKPSSFGLVFQVGVCYP